MFAPIIMTMHSHCDRACATAHKSKSDNNGNGNSSATTQPITKQIRLFFKPKTIEFSHNLCEKFVTNDTNFLYFPAASNTESHLFRLPEMCVYCNASDALDINRYTSTNILKTFEHKSLIHLNCVQTKEVVN